MFSVDIVLTVTEEIPPHCFDFIINHVFLPPQLPQHTEDATGESNSALLQLLLHCSRDYGRKWATSDFQKSQWPAANKLIQSFVAFENSNAFSAQLFAKTVIGMHDGGIMALALSMRANLTVSVEALSASISPLRMRACFYVAREAPFSSLPTNLLPPRLLSLTRPESCLSPILVLPSSCPGLQ